MSEGSMGSGPESEKSQAFKPLNDSEKTELNQGTDSYIQEVIKSQPPIDATKINDHLQKNIGVESPTPMSAAEKSQVKENADSFLLNKAFKNVGKGVKTSSNSSDYIAGALEITNKPDFQADFRQTPSTSPDSSKK
jgi:hypothetical protein